MDTCKTCGQKCKSEQGLRVHGARNPECETGLPPPKTKKTHHKRKSRVGFFACPHCAHRPFVHRGRYEKHLQNVHSAEIEAHSALRTAAVAGPPKPTYAVAYRRQYKELVRGRTKDRRIPCPLCDDFGGDSTCITTRNHIREEHPEERKRFFAGDYTAYRRAPGFGAAMNRGSSIAEPVQMYEEAEFRHCPSCGKNLVPGLAQAKLSGFQYQHCTKCGVQVQAFEELDRLERSASNGHQQALG